MKYIKIFIIFVLIFIFSFYLFLHFQNKNIKDEIFFLNVGKGSGALIKTKNNKHFLIDLSDKPIAQKSLLKELGFFNRKIDSIFLTHYGIDHSGVLLNLLKNYKVYNFFTTSFVPKNIYQKKLYDKINLYLKKNKITKNFLKKGDIIKINNNIFIEVLYPFESLKINNMKINETSLVLQINFLVNKNIRQKILITGDLSSNMENFLVKKYGKKLKSDILLAGHHGSKNSSSYLFLKTVAPRYLIIQAGLNNRYNHPNKIVLERAEKLGIKF